MRTIRKSRPPAEVSAFLKQTPTASFEDLESKCPTLRSALAAEQHDLCAYCCIRLSNDLTLGRTRISHIVPQTVDRGRATDYFNIVLSCDTEFEVQKSCDVKQGETSIEVSPTLPDVQSLFRFSLSGKIEGVNRSAETTIAILGLDCDRLNTARRIAIYSALKNRSRVTPAKWTAVMSGNFEPLPSFQPAIADALARM